MKVEARKVKARLEVIKITITITITITIIIIIIIKQSSIYRRNSCLQKFVVIGLVGWLVGWLVALNHHSLRVNHHLIFVAFLFRYGSIGLLIGFTCIIDNSPTGTA